LREAGGPTAKPVSRPRLGTTAPGKSQRGIITLLSQRLGHQRSERGRPEPPEVGVLCRATWPRRGSGAHTTRSRFGRSEAGRANQVAAAPVDALRAPRPRTVRPEHPTARNALFRGFLPRIWTSGSQVRLGAGGGPSAASPPSANGRNVRACRAGQIHSRARLACRLTQTWPRRTQAPGLGYSLTSSLSCGLVRCGNGYGDVQRQSS
jgi:hypothetical protein